MSLHNVHNFKKMFYLQIYAKHVASCDIMTMKGLKYNRCKHSCYNFKFYNNAALCIFYLILLQSIKLNANGMTVSADNYIITGHFGQKYRMSNRKVPCIARLLRSAPASCPVGLNTDSHIILFPWTSDSNFFPTLLYIFIHAATTHL